MSKRDYYDVLGVARTSSADEIKKAMADESCFLLLDRNDEDLWWRLALIDSAQVSLDMKTFIWARDFSHDGRPFQKSALDWFPVRYFDCYRVLPEDHPRHGLNCETRYQVKACRRFYEKLSSEWRRENSRYVIKVFSQGDEQTAEMFADFDQINEYVEGLLDRFLEISCS